MTDKDPKAFDLSLFLAGVTPETAFVDVYPDRRLMAELSRLKHELAEVADNEAPTALTEVPRSTQLRKKYEELSALARERVLTVEVREIIHSVRTALTKQFMADKDVTEEEIAEDRLGLGAELDYYVLQRAMVYPKLDTPEDVKKFAEAIGDIQWGRILEAWEKTLMSSTTLQDIDITF